MKVLQFIDLNFEPGSYLRNDRYDLSHDFEYPALSICLFSNSFRGLRMWTFWRLGLDILYVTRSMRPGSTAWMAMT